MAVLCAVLFAVGLVGSGHPSPPASPASLEGIVGYADPVHGARYLAMRLPRGTAVRICGPQGCVRRTVNDWGPSERLHPDRIADLSYPDFGAVCGSHSMGLCLADAVVLDGLPVALPATDTP